MVLFSSFFFLVGRKVGQVLGSGSIPIAFLVSKVGVGIDVDVDVVVGTSIPIPIPQSPCSILCHPIPSPFLPSFLSHLVLSTPSLLASLAET